MKGWLSSLLSNHGGGASLEESATAVDDRRRQERIPADEEVTLLWTDEDGPHQMPQVQVLDHSDDGFSVRSQRPFRVGFDVRISDTSGTHRTSVRYCEQQGDHYILGLYRFSKEQRRFDRMPVSGSATLHWSSETAGPRSTQVKILNASDDGLQVDSSEAVPTEIVVKVAGESVECFGTVWYCKDFGERYLIGIQLARAPHLKDSPDYNEL